MNPLVHVVCPHCHATNRVPGTRLADGATCGRCKEALFMGEPVELDASSLAQHLQYSDLPVVVDFWAPWCGPCRTMAPHFAQAARLLEPQVRLVKINTEAHPALANQHGIRSIPTLAVFVAGQEVERRSGAMPAEALVQWVRGVVS